VHLTVQSVAGKERTEAITLAQSPPDPTNPGPPHAFLGIATSTKQQPKLPVNVTIDAGNIGGPSAGLSFTLGVIEDLTAGDLTGGKTVAVTGTINPDGTVGDVGGVAQKTVAVRNSGAVAFLVPPAEYAVAVKHAGSHLKIIKVANLEDALNALKGLGGDLSAITTPALASIDSGTPGSRSTIESLRTRGSLSHVDRRRPDPVRRRVRDVPRRGRGSGPGGAAERTDHQPAP